MTATGQPGRADAALVERGEVLAAVSRLLDAARGGRGGALFIVGPAGLGKTTVWEHALIRAGPRFEVGTGRGDRVEAVLPFGVISQALDGLLGTDLGAPSHGQDAEVSAQTRWYEILRGVREAAVRPLLLAFDDLHWSDPDSLTVIHLLCRRLGSLPVALLATLRPWPAEALTTAQELAAQGVAELEYLAPLSAPAARAVLRARSGRGVPAAMIEQAIGRCGGNPLLLDQLAGQLRRDGRISEGGVLLSRFLAVDDPGQRYVRAASVLGTRFRSAVATEVAEVIVPEVTGSLDAVFHGGLVRDAGGGWAEFSHALIRQAVYDDLAPPVRTALHAAAFTALLDHQANPAEAAEHAVAANLVGDARAVTTLAQAGREALAAGAVRAGRRHLEAAAGLAGPGASPALLVDLGRALFADGAGETAILSYERVLAHPESSDVDRIAALRHLGQAAFAAGQLDRAAACYDSAVEVAQPAHPDLAVAALLDHVFHTLMTSGTRAALPRAARARELAATQGVMRASAEAAWGSCAYRCGDAAGLDAVAAAATSMVYVPASPTSGRHWYWDPVLIYAIRAVDAERFTDAERLFTDILDSACRCEPFALAQALRGWAKGLCRLGRLAEAGVLAERLIEISELFSHLGEVAGAYRALVLLEQGQLDQVASWCEQQAPQAQDPKLYFGGRMALYVRATLALRQADATTACSLFAQLHELAERSGESDPAYLPWAPEAIRAYLACDRDGAAQGVLDWVRPRAAALPICQPKIIFAVGSAMLAERTGDRAAAEAWFAQALARHDEMDPGMPLVRAATLTDYGAFLTRGGQAARARPLLAEAAHLAEACGAGWHAGRARAEWRRAGGRTRTRGSDQLSPPEAAVAALARTGHTNREIAGRLHLSIKTVETHLRHVYQKLGIHSRWQLAKNTDLEPHETPGS